MSNLTRPKSCYKIHTFDQFQSGACGCQPVFFKVYIPPKVATAINRWNPKEERFPFTWADPNIVYKITIDFCIFINPYDAYNYCLPLHPRCLRPTDPGFGYPRLMYTFEYEDMPNDDGTMYWQIDHQWSTLMWRKLISYGYSVEKSDKLIRQALYYREGFHGSYPIMHLCQRCHEPFYTIVAQEDESSLIANESMEANISRSPSPTIDFDDHLMTIDEIINELNS